MLSIFAVVLLGLLSFVYFFFYHPLQYWKIRGVPYVEPEFYYGNFRGVGKTIHITSFLSEMYGRLKGKGPVGGTYWFVQPKLIVTDLDFVKQILVKDFNVFANRGLYFNEVDDPLSANLVNLEDEAWRNLRRKVTPAFASGKLKSMFELLAQTTDKLVNKIKMKSLNGDSVEVADLIVRFTIDTVASSAFGIESNCIEGEDNELVNAVLNASQPVNFFTRNILQKHRRLGQFLRLCERPKKVTLLLLDNVRRMIESRKSNPEYKRNDFMDTMIKMNDPASKNRLTFNQVAALATIILSAGNEGPSNILTFCMHELSLSKKFQSKARESVIQGLKNHDGDLNYESLKEMVYLDQCINETLRKYPTAPGLTRVAAVDYKIPNSNIIIEKGMKINIPICAIHYDSNIYPDPEKFDPDRFLPDEVAERHPFSFIPFGDGPRICIGNRFAMLQLKLALAKILTTFEFEIDKTRNVVKTFSKQGFAIKPEKNYYINFHEIK